MDARPHAEGLQPLGGATGQVEQLAVAQPLAHEIERRTVRPLRGGVVEDLLHRLRLDLGVPAHAFGVGLDPGHIVHGNLRPCIAVSASGTDSVL